MFSADNTCYQITSYPIFSWDSTLENLLTLSL
jgi:hypothetical protein